MPSMVSGGGIRVGDEGSVSARGAQVSAQFTIECADVPA